MTKTKKIEKIFTVIKRPDGTTFEFPDPDFITKRRMLDKLDEIIEVVNELREPKYLTDDKGNLWEAKIGINRLNKTKEVVEKRKKAL